MSRRFVSDSWAFLLTPLLLYVLATWNQVFFLFHLHMFYRSCAHILESVLPLLYLLDVPKCLWEWCGFMAHGRHIVFSHDPSNSLRSREEGSYQLSHAYDWFLGTSTTYCAKNGWRSDIFILLMKTYSGSRNVIRPHMSICHRVISFKLRACSPHANLAGVYRTCMDGYRRPGSHLSIRRPRLVTFCVWKWVSIKRTEMFLWWTLQTIL